MHHPYGNPLEIVVPGEGDVTEVEVTRSVGNMRDMASSSRAVDSARLERATSPDRHR